MPINLKQDTIAQHLDNLRNPNIKEDYTIEGHVDIRSIAGASENWRLNDLIILDDSKLIIGPTTLNIIIEGIISTNSQTPVTAILSYPKNDRKAANGKNGLHGSIGASGSSDGSSGQNGVHGEDGTDGDNGLDAGDVLIQLSNPVNSEIRINLEAQSGGKGGSGGNGGEGHRGSKAVDGIPFTCKRGGGNGGNGGRGGNGGAAGLGGDAGDGGKLIVIGPQIEHQPLSSISLESHQAAAKGQNGNQGNKGIGGRQGGGGHGSTWCKGGKGGRKGADGYDGIIENDTRPEFGRPPVISYITIPLRNY
ncbi:hypothetical protein [Carboxylicivirga caseinilyticus]|uniref:hypothetical protein n=1 Tax=Carboxylicivirga caseinilyticus TaxID=3417572 RepID=UPI003D32E631|nr:hypothetical protein [Marinilabiliaceae bacterium A049]